MRGRAGEVEIGLLASEEPPATARKGMRSELLALVPALREQAGTWFKVAVWKESPTGASSQATILRKLRSDVEWASRTNGKGSVLYARHLGKGSK